MLKRYAALVVLAVAVTVAAPYAQKSTTAPRVTPPKDQFGFAIGDDYRLVNYTQYVDYLKPSLVMWQKLIWDARMASSVARCRECGGTVDAREIAEVFFPKTFLQLLLPLVGAAWKWHGAFASHRL